ncbi:MAG: hypothetical protein LRY40_03090 [Shewanella fodinae]|nr:hypothetical protein [Shewanella fodinae]
MVMLCGLRVLFTLALLLTTQCSWAAIILQYHHVSETTPKVTSVTPVQFKQQMQYLADNGFRVVPLADVVQAIKSKQELPAKTVAITFDDGYRSIFDTARLSSSRLVPLHAICIGYANGQRLQ